MCILAALSSSGIETAYRMWHVSEIWSGVVWELEHGAKRWWSRTCDTERRCC